LLDLWRIEPVPLRPAALLRLMLAILPVSLRLERASLALAFGATMTSASGDNFRNGVSEPAGGAREVTVILAVEVGER
jgi:hypothetical protein